MDFLVGMLLRHLLDLMVAVVAVGIAVLVALYKDRRFALLRIESLSMRIEAIEKLINSSCVCQEARRLLAETKDELSQSILPAYQAGEYELVHEAATAARRKLRTAKRMIKRSLRSGLDPAEKLT